MSRQSKPTGIYRVKRENKDSFVIEEYIAYYSTLDKHDEYFWKQVGGNYNTQYKAAKVLKDLRKSEEGNPVDDVKQNTTCRNNQSLFLQRHAKITNNKRQPVFNRRKK